MITFAEKDYEPISVLFIYHLEIDIHTFVIRMMQLFRRCGISPNVDCPIVKQTRANDPAADTVANYASIQDRRPIRRITTFDR